MFHIPIAGSTGSVLDRRLVDLFYDMLSLALLSLFVGTLFSTAVELSLSRIVDTPFLVEFGSRMMNFVGIGIVAYLYLLWSGLGESYIDLRTETLSRRSMGIIFVSIVCSLLLTLGFNFIVLTLSTHPAGMNTVQIDQSLVQAVLLMLVVILFNAPAEELLFRNIIQKRFRLNSTSAIAIVLSSVIFVLLHIPAQLSAGFGIESGLSLVLLFFLSVVFGVVFRATDNLLAPILAHAAYNSIQIVFQLFTVS